MAVGTIRRDTGAKGEVGPRRAVLRRCGALVAAVSVAGSGAALAGTFAELARTGDPEPGSTTGATLAEGLAFPVLGENGTAVFGGTFRINGFADGAGLLYVEPGGSLRVALRSPDPTPNSDGNFQAPFLPSVTPDGDLLSGAFIQSSLIANGTAGLYRVEGGASATPGAVAELARTGATTTDLGGTLLQIAFAGLQAPQQTAPGNVYLFGTVLGGSRPGASTIRLTPGGAAEQVFTAGESLPEFSGVTVLTSVPRLPQVNDNDDLALYARLLDASGQGILTPANDEALLMRTDANGLQRVVIEGASVPGGNGVFGNAPTVPFAQVFTDPAMNDRSDLAFASQVLGSSGGSLDDDGVFRRLADGTTETLARGGDFTPSNDGRFTNLVQESFEHTLINDNGSVAFLAGLSGATGGSTRGLFLYTDNAGLQEVARLGQGVPDGTGTLSFLEDFALNDNDELAFVGLVDDGGFSDETALFRFDPATGLETLVREGDTLGGEAVTQVRFQAAELSAGEDRDGLNDAGQIAFQAVMSGQFVNWLWTPTSDLSGDYNDSGLVEQGDLNLVLNNWGQAFDVIPAGWINQRPTSGIVDQAELNVVLNNWGSGASPVFNGASVPEPGTMAVLAGVAGVLARRRRPRR